MVLDGGEPLRFNLDLRERDVGVVLTVDVRHHGFEPGETGQRDDLTQAMYLVDRCDCVEPRTVAPDAVGEASHVKVRVDGDVIAEALRCGQDRIELDLLDGTLGRAAALDRANRVEHVLVTEWRELLGDFGLPLQEVQVGHLSDDLQVFPELTDDPFDAGAQIGQREDAHGLREIGVRCRADQQATVLLAGLVRVRTKPWPATGTEAERVELDLAGIGHASPLAALAVRPELREVAARARLLEPELAPTVRVRSMDERLPGEVID